MWYHLTGMVRCLNNLSRLFTSSNPDVPVKLCLTEFVSAPHYLVILNLLLVYVTLKEYLCKGLLSGIRKPTSSFDFLLGIYDS